MGIRGIGSRFSPPENPAGRRFVHLAESAPSTAPGYAPSRPQCRLVRQSPPSDARLGPLAPDRYAREPPVDIADRQRRVHSGRRPVRREPCTSTPVFLPGYRAGPRYLTLPSGTDPDRCPSSPVVRRTEMFGSPSSRSKPFMLSGESLSTAPRRSTRSTMRWST